MEFESLNKQTGDLESWRNEFHQRRDIHNFGFIQKGTFHRRPDKLIETREECRQRFARPGRCRDEHIAARRDFVPGKFLRFGRPRERVREPFLNEGMKFHDESALSVAEKKSREAAARVYAQG